MSWDLVWISAQKTSDLDRFSMIWWYLTYPKMMDLEFHGFSMKPWILIISWLLPSRWRSSSVRCCLRLHLNRIKLSHKTNKHNLTTQFDGLWLYYTTILYRYLLLFDPFISFSYLQEDFWWFLWETRNEWTVHLDLPPFCLHYLQFQ